MESIGMGQLMRVLAICVVAYDKFLILEEKGFETDSDDNRLPNTFGAGSSKGYGSVVQL